MNLTRREVKQKLEQLVQGAHECQAESKQNARTYKFFGKLGSKIWTSYFLVIQGLSY